MLEKNSERRISAEKALDHPFFIGEMDIEFDYNSIFKELTNSSDYAAKMVPVTPSSFTSRKEKRASFGKPIKKASKVYV